MKINTNNYENHKNNHEDLCQFIQINENQNKYTQVHDNNVNDAHTTNIYDNILKKTKNKIY